jgi:hypothetical protein
MTCSICRHAARHEIDQALIDGAPLRDIAGRHGLAKSAVARHKADHLAALLAKADVDEITNADDLIGRLRALNRETAAVLHDAKAAKDHGLRLKALARLERQVELEAKLLGELDGRQPNVTIAMFPEYLDALREFGRATDGVAGSWKEPALMDGSP